MKRQDLLKKVAMPKKEAPAMEADQDLEMLGEGDEMMEPEEAPAMEEGAEPEGDDMMAEMLKELSDDDIIAEAKRRGLLEDGEMPEAPEEV